ncbi:restriction endonuclease subunit S [Limosilactobacillus fastidiosus]|uniref:Restriction endonuclease subunit S n=1 Tax=Limosilactobacillus fastidiosus TaxID=2759855 RepID=A0ABR6E5K3_9LACO|nr:restriction endonuclease subunit S [Limosilactobacillus fastidiosus]MBB1062297.1 restriction endonuclease subunit S [Limosilactobacillus fastidiosus]MCD7083374.1 restriction endonuclease subunit S [Limosilactobacillus fastidiosus]
MDKKPKGMVPKVRFKGFTDDWEQRKLKSISTRILRKNKDLQSDRPLTISAQDGLVDQTDYFNKQIASKQLTKYFLLTRGDFAYNKSYSVDFPYGAIKRLNRYKNGVLSTLYLVFKPLDSVNSDFLEHYYDTSKWYSEIYRNAAEGARNHGLLNISAEDFFNTTLIIPVKVKEQNKIANLLNIINKLLSLQQRKLDLLKQLKKGLLQKMFADKNNKQPVLRFDGFSGDWEQRKLGEVAKVTMGQSPSSKYYTTNPNDHILIQGNADLKSGKVVPRVWTKEITKSVHNGEIIMTVRAPVGYLAIASMNAVIGRGVAAIEGDKYLFYLLQTKLMNNTWKRISSGSTFESISSNDIKKLKVTLPKDNERNSISKLMDVISHLLSLQQRRLGKLTYLKKFFLQKLFI